MCTLLIWNNFLLGFGIYFVCKVIILGFYSTLGCAYSFKKKVWVFSISHRTFFWVKLRGNSPTVPVGIKKKLREKESFQEATLTSGRIPG